MLILTYWDCLNKGLNTIFYVVQVWHSITLTSYCFFLFSCLSSSSSPLEAGPRSHLLCPHALGLWPGQWWRAGRGPMDGAGARASPAAPERLAEERPGAGQGQKAKGRAAIAREEGGARCCPPTHLLQLSHPSVPHSSCFSFVVLQHKNLTPLNHEDKTVVIPVFRRKRGKTCWKHVVPLSQKKNTTVLKFPCSHTEPIWRKKNYHFAEN